jgi:adenylate cyclase
MATEIERKFLVDHSKLPPLPTPHIIRQGYIPASGVTVRIRRMDSTAFLTLKGKTEGVSRLEFEYAIPVEEAEAMLASLCMQPFVDKKRYMIEYEGHTWELDIFEGENDGLIIAEIELSDENEDFAMPPWVDKEVSHDPKYRNGSLVKYPYSHWERNA